MSTSKMYPPVPVTSQIAMGTISSMLTLCSVLGNGFFLAIVARFKTLRTVPNILAANLALVDLLNPVVNMPIYLFGGAFEANWFRGKALSITALFFHRVFLCLNLASRLLIIMNLCMAITFGLRYLAWKTKDKAYTATFLLWVISLVLSLLTCIPQSEIDLGDAFVKDYRKKFYQDGRSFAATTFGTFMICGAILGIITYRSIRRKKSDMAKFNLRPLETQARLSADIKAVKTLSISLATYILSYFPAVMYAIFGLRDKTLGDSWFAFITWSSLFISGSSNPLLYFIRGNRLRSALRQFIKHPCKKSDYKEDAAVPRGQGSKEVRNKCDRVNHDETETKWAVNISIKEVVEQAVPKEENGIGKDQQQSPLNGRRIYQENQAKANDYKPTKPKQHSGNFASEGRREISDKKDEDVDKTEARGKSIKITSITRKIAFPKNFTQVAPQQNLLGQDFSLDMTTVTQEPQGHRKAPTDSRRESLGWRKSTVIGQVIGWVGYTNEDLQYSEDINK